MNRYHQRDQVLAKIGFTSYREYLSSPLWASIRTRLFRVCSTCPCGAKATQIHHRTYKERYMLGRGKIHKFLVPVCETCHKKIEFAGDAKRSLGGANNALDEIIEKGIASGVKRPRKCVAKTRHV